MNWVLLAYLHGQLSKISLAVGVCATICVFVFWAALMLVEVGDEDDERFFRRVIGKSAVLMFVLGALYLTIPDRETRELMLGAYFGQSIIDEQSVGELKALPKNLLGATNAGLEAIQAIADATTSTTEN